MAGRPGLTVAERAIEDGLVKPLGEGGFGAVWLWRGPSGEMAVKIVQKNTGKKHRNVNILLQTRTEASTMANLKHPNIVALHHFLETDSSLYLCLQLCHGGDLLDLINSSGRLPQWIAKVYFRQLMEAVKYVHDQGYIHRDIKCENIFLSSTRQEIFLGDFGLSGTWAPGKLQKLSWGSPHYASPEISTGSTYVGPEVDMWSCGVVLYAMVMAALPFTGPTDADVIEAVAQGDYPPITSCAGARSVAERILVVDANKRATVDQVLRHPWISAAPPALQRVSSDPERLSAIAAQIKEQAAATNATPAVTEVAATATAANATTKTSNAAPPTTTTATTQTTTTATTAAVVVAQKPAAPTAVAVPPTVAPPAAAAATVKVPEVSLAKPGRTAADEERESRIRGSSIIDRKKPAAGAPAEGATIVQRPSGLPPPHPSGSIINRPPQTKAGGGSGSRIGGSRIGRRPSMPEGSNLGSRLLESKRRTEFKMLGPSLRQSRKNLQALKEAAGLVPPQKPAPKTATPTSPQPQPQPQAAAPKPPAPRATGSPLRQPASSPASASGLQPVTWHQTLLQTMATEPKESSSPPSKGGSFKREKKAKKKDRGSAAELHRTEETSAVPKGPMSRVRSRSLEDLVSKAGADAPSEEEKLLWQIQKEAPHSDQVANLYLQLIRRIVADPSLSFARLPRQRRPMPANAPLEGAKSAPGAAPTVSVTAPTPASPGIIPVSTTTTSFNMSQRYVKVAYLMTRKSSSLLGPITSGKFKSRLCCLSVDGTLTSFRGLEEQAAGIAIDTVTDLITCDLVIEPTEEERSAWIVDLLKLRPFASLIALLNDQNIGRYAATAACLQAVEKPEATTSALAKDSHVQLYNYLETHGPKMDALTAGTLTDALTAMICKFSVLPESTVKLQFALPLLLRVLSDINEKRSSLALQTLQNVSSGPAFITEIRRLGGVPRLLEVLSDLLDNSSGESGVSFGESKTGSGNRLMLEKDGLVNKIASPQKAPLRPMSVALSLSLEQWRALIAHFKDPILGVPVRDRTWRLRNVPLCFVGSQAVDWLIVHKYAKTREDAVSIGARLLSEGEFSHVQQEHPFKDAKIFYRFADASAELKQRKLNKMVAHETARNTDTSMDDLLVEFDPIEAALYTLANCAKDTQVQVQLGQSVMVSVVPVLSAIHALKQPRLTLPMLELLARGCSTDFLWRGLRSAGLLFDVLQKDITSPEDTQAQLNAQIEALKTEMAQQRRTNNTNRLSKNPKDKERLS